MQAVVYDQPRQLRLEEIADPVPGPGRSAYVSA